MRLEEIIGAHIADRRADEGMSQAELGEALGQHLEKPWSRQAVHAAEKGKRAFTAAELVAIALALDVELSELMEPPLKQRHEDVELQRGTISARKLAAVVAPETPEQWERRADLKTLRQISPMLTGVIQTLKILNISLGGLLTTEEEQEARENPEGAQQWAQEALAARATLTAALADMVGQSVQSEDRKAAIKRVEKALAVATGTEGGSDS
ncbi:helix-turn-helix transcriptional regulator [Streptomyces sp. NBC_01451]|uniref:helix-turn-helix transcriptional regulator n=1 Tax=Streptomyces sp. NBC_01451 TaxID=2903872 RepID=UPI002E36795D|nr:helix-turn-helix transcriptional regulator [Streptomyces sp. NBC_01451]